MGSEKARGASPSEAEPSAAANVLVDRTVTSTDDPLPISVSRIEEQLDLPPTPARFYRIEEEVGRGGVGVVVRAHDRRLGRQVALKQLQYLEPRARMRFEREMRITAKLQHPGVVPIHEAGVLDSGSPFYAMKLIEGRSLKAIIAECKTLDERLAQLSTIIQVVETIAYAHSKDVIHRDIKPSNVIVGAYGETVVIDWGLAKDLGASDELPPPAVATGDAADDMTIAGQVVGTPAYMAPEQARGEEAGKAADVYALGGILRQLITGRLPYDVRSSNEMLEALKTQSPVSMALASPNAPRDLCAVIEKAMEHDPASRYADASTLLVDLKNFVNGRLVSAYSYAPAERVRKWVARRRGIVATAAIALLIVAGVGTWSFLGIVRERDVAIRSRKETIEQSNALLREQASRELDQHNASRAFDILKSYPKDALDWREVFPLVNRMAMDGLPDTWLSTESQSGHYARIDPTGTLAVAASAQELKAWHIDSGTLAYRIPLDSGKDVVLNSFTTDRGATSPFAYGGMSDGQIFIVELTDTPSKPQRYLVCDKGSVSDIATTTRGRFVAYGCSDGRTGELDLESRKIRQLGAKASGRASVGFVGPLLIVSTAGDSLLRISSVDGSTPTLASEIGGKNRIVAARPECDRVVIGTSDGKLLALSVSGTRREEYLVDAGNFMVSVGIDPECRFAFGISEFYRMVLIDLRTHGIVRSTTARAAAFYPKRSGIVVGTEMGDVEYWEPLSGWRQSWRVSNAPIRSVFVSPEGDIGALGDELSIFRSGRIAETLMTQTAISSMAISSDESSILLGGRTGGAGLIDARNPRSSIFTYWHSGPVLTRSGRNDALYSAGWGDGCVVRWLRDEAPELLFCSPSGVVDIAISSTGLVYVANFAGSVLKYDPSSGEYAVASGFEQILRITIDPQTDNVIVTTSSGNMSTLDAQLHILASHDLKKRMGVAYVDDRGQLIAATQDGHIYPPAATMPSPGPFCTDIANRYWISDSGRRLLAGCKSGEVVSWPRVAGLERITQVGSISDVDGNAEGTVVAAVSSAGTISIVNVEARTAIGIKAINKLGNIELLSDQDLIVAAVADVGIVSFWHLSRQPHSYPMDDADLHRWLHQLKGN
jgi:serine/threonine protein kinase/WD40 repeat protein